LIAHAAVAQRRYSGSTLQGTDYFLTGAEGSTTGLFSSSGFLRTYTYDPDGTATASGSGATTDLKFAGGYQIPNGLYHFIRSDTADRQDMNERV
jgi:hypothetical protein